MKVKPNFELHHNLYIIALTEKKYMNKTNNKKTCTVYKGAHGGCGRKFEHFGRIYQVEENRMLFGAIVTAISFYRENMNCCTQEKSRCST